jgi:dienelactone hydrolase
MIYKYLLLVLFVFVFNASYANDTLVQMLNAQIQQLTAERDAKRQMLADCQSKRQKLKIAGIATLATTGVGVGANVVMASKLASAESGGVSASGSGMPADTRSQEQKNCDTCASFKKLNISPMPDECSGC